MGAQQSSRKISIQNDEPANVIKISDSLVDRLRGATKSEAESAGVAPAQFTSPAPQIYYPSLTALEIKKDMEEQLEQNNIYWMRRLEELELAHKKIDYIMEKEFGRAVEDVQERFKKLPTSYNAPPCLERKQQLIKCYAEHKMTPIECAEEVRKFTSCVNKERAELLHKRG